MASITIITPWKDHPELIPDYERSVSGAFVIVIDNASLSENALQIKAMVERLQGIYLRNESNEGFAAANNLGLAYAGEELVMFLNNDIAAPAGLFNGIDRDVPEGVLAGPSLQRQLVYGLWLPYLEGWCIAGRRRVWDRLGGWDAAAYPDPFWEDNDLCLRAVEAGLKLVLRPWPITHKGGKTIQSLLRWGEVFERNRATFAARVRPVYERLRLQRGYAP
jgi:GT2 family glycosyltransferase